ncbi:transmembrane protein, putative (macronuclear) [Tetrahymena thermophila SB210]|uniref:Transmembrane protein, putative n=1 Tax=Tetrahymena thermophila (strain SB210) TaxID=312017 RepID=W7XG07_TETTS|nr:transmembrane protein, putative [Tetrahymena thermophila SB210]EWS73001.1 transmembrane protein, putative [Tetrahymena thermophila SB210]|eukprot:XP_012654469.1 transmembrane protein, putative [Tetrahymena thermophila SB210]
MIENTESLKKLKILNLYKESIKSLFKFYYVIMAFFIAYAITAFISSINLKDKYDFYENLQTIIIILVSYTIFFKFLGFYVLKKKELTNGIFLLVFLIFITTNVPPVIQLVSFLEGSFEKYCGYLIRHDGYVSPNTITYYLERNYPSCSQLEAQGNIQEQIKYYSFQIIIKQCSYRRAVDSCYQFDTLKVDNWNDMFVVQIVSFCLACIQIFSTTAFLLILKGKHVQATQKAEQEIRQNLLNQSCQSQVSQFQQPFYQQIQPQNPQFINYQPNIQSSFQVYSDQQLNFHHPINVQNPQIQNQNQTYIVGQPINS